MSRACIVFTAALALAAATAARASEGPYAIEGGADEFFGTGIICKLSEPFVAEESGNKVDFVPQSAKAGT